MYKELGVIRDAWIKIEDHGCLTFMLMFDFGGSVQGFGNYNLGTKNNPDRTGVTFDAIYGILETVGVEGWDELRGKEMFVIRNDEFGEIIGIEAPKYRGAKTLIWNDIKDRGI